MLAEIFLIRLEMLLRVAASNSSATTSDRRFVPFALPRQARDDERKTG